MGKVIGYVRVSTEGQEVNGQRHAILEYANAHGMQVEIREFVVSSRKDAKARGIDELLEVLSDGDTLLITELSRIGRNMLQTLTLVDQLAQKGVKLIFIKQPELSTDGSFRELLIAVYGYIAQTEREYISMRTKQGLAAAKAKGQKLGRPKGSRSSKLDDREEEIKGYLELGISQASIAKLMRVSKPSMHYFLKTRGLKKP